MLTQLAQAFEEIALEMGHEVTISPLRMLAEIVQFVLLVGIIWVVAVGWGKRRGFVANLLSERAERIDKQIQASSHADEDLASAQQTASGRVSSAEAKAREMLDAARSESQQAESAAREEADREAERIVERAQVAITTETSQMVAEMRDELVGLVAAATRSIMSETVGVAEQRALIESAITASLGEETAEKPAARVSARKPRTASKASGRVRP